MSITCQPHSLHSVDNNQTPLTDLIQTLQPTIAFNDYSTYLSYSICTVHCPLMRIFEVMRLFEYTWSFLAYLRHT